MTPAIVDETQHMTAGALADAVDLTKPKKVTGRFMRNGKLYEVTVVEIKQ